MARHPNFTWELILPQLERHASVVSSLQAMESTGGQPDIVASIVNVPGIVFVDCSPESPAGRRSLCYDEVALESRKEHKPKGSALGEAAKMGIHLLSPDQYRALQNLEEFDLKTSSWLQTPERIRELGGSIFGDRRFDTVFVYHNGAESYYASRGFRGWIEIPS